MTDELYGYDKLIAQDGIKIVAKESFGVWSGENAWILRRGRHEYGFYTDSYGSCSLCDSYEMYASEDDTEGLEQLGQDMRNGITWFKSKQALAVFLLNRDHEVQAYDYYNIGDWFKEQAKILLGSE